uniref:Uncharacterized protein n=1 Tax=Meloidogyne incognita TaxID=6306 RepID=A0A914KXC8_MELIC
MIPIFSRFNKSINSFIARFHIPHNCTNCRLALKSAYWLTAFKLFTIYIGSAFCIKRTLNNNVQKYTTRSYSNLCNEVKRL